MKELERFLDDLGRIRVWPSKQEMKLAVVAYLSTQFEPDRNYTEKEVNAIINAWHTFGDYFLLRRSLVDFGYMARTRNGASYWKKDRPIA